uniref:TLDc domain-containing protein n=1 Tax=Timema monikensis TaxID=170555 RepID=A0A7R9HIJ8_9NEOP|nr:unnamed protein product [Timema monikensis]
MGNNHSRGSSPSSDIPSSSISRTNSGTDIQEKSQTLLLPLEKLAKLLVQKTSEEDHVPGISCRIFTKYVFPRYFDLAQKLYKYLLGLAGPMKGGENILSQSAFKQQTEKLLTGLEETHQTDIYIKMYAEGDEITREQFNELLLAAYRLAMDFYPDGPPRTCLQLYKVLKAVVDSAFHRKDCLPVQYLSNWVSSHCPRLVVGLHRYVVHALTTTYRTLGKDQTDSGPVGLDLSTPVLEREPSFENDDNVMLPLSEVWLLATSLPLLFTKPSEHHSPDNLAAGLTSHNFVTKLLGSICPSHWTLLYNSNDHGLGANRFMHHVLSYRGSTLTFLRGEGGVQFCVAASTEWKESHQYWGGDDCVVIQLLPNYQIIQKGAKLLYFNLSIRGYPKGLRAGQDQRAPCLQVDEGFNLVTFCGIPYRINSVEVWGCGSQRDRWYGRVGILPVAVDAGKETTSPAAVDAGKETTSPVTM